MGIAVKSERFIFPPRPSLVVPFSDCGEFVDLGWSCQLKYNDSRSLFKFVDGVLSHWNRRGERFRDIIIPDHVREQLEWVCGLFDGWLLLDGGYLDAKHRAIKDTVVLWDFLVMGGEQPITSFYGTRYDLLVSKCGAVDSFIIDGVGDVGLRVSDNILIPRNYPAGDYPGLINWMRGVNESVGGDLLFEGLVWKCLAGELEPGYSVENNVSWLAKSRFPSKRSRS